MSELAFDEDGQHFQVPATVARWRTRRFNNPGKPGGAQVVYGDDGLPLFLDVETTAEEFREAVGGVPGRYRLDGADAHGRIVDGVPPAYLMINGSATANGGGEYNARPPASSSLEYALVEMARANSDAIRSVADRFGGICDSVANVVRAADGAGLPRRAPLGPLLVDHVDQDGDEEDDERERNAAAQPAQPTLVTVLGQVMQMVQVFAQMSGSGNPAKLGAVMSQVVETAKVVEAVGTTASAPTAPSAPEPTNDGDHDVRATSAKANTVNGAHVANGTHATHGAQRDPVRARPSSPGAGRVPPTSAPATSAPSVADPMAQFQQIMAALTPEEQAQVQYVITTLSVRDLMQWYEQLAGMSVAEGVAKIRAELARIPTEHAA